MNAPRGVETERNEMIARINALHTLSERYRARLELIAKRYPLHPAGREAAVALREVGCG